MDFKSTAILALFAALLGCSGGDSLDYPRAGVSGFVTLDDAPLKEGVIRFVPIEGTPGPKVSVPISAGAYMIEEEYGPFVGKNRIEIESTDTGGVAFDDEQKIAELRNNPQPIEVVTVPAKYNSASELTEVVEADATNEFNFDLSSQ